MVGRVMSPWMHRIAALAVSSMCVVDSAAADHAVGGDKPFRPGCDAVSVSLAAPRQSLQTATLVVSVRNCSRRPVQLDEADLPWAMSGFLEFWVESPGTTRRIDAVYPIVDAMPGVRVLIAEGQQLSWRESFIGRFPRSASLGFTDDSVVRWRFIPRPDAYCGLAADCSTFEGVVGRLCKGSSTGVVDSVCRHGFKRHS